MQETQKSTLFVEQCFFVGLKISKHICNYFTSFLLARHREKAVANLI